MLYEKRSLDGHFYKAKGFYVFFIPIKVPYKKIYGLAAAAGLKRKQEFGPILEQGKMFGFGWIGVEVEKPAQTREDVVRVSGDFEVAQHRGPYQTLGKTCKRIMKDRPGAKERYNLYLDDPEKTRPEDLRTEIYFR